MTLQLIQVSYSNVVWLGHTHSSSAITNVSSTHPQVLLNSVRLPEHSAQESKLEHYKQYYTSHPIQVVPERVALTGHTHVLLDTMNVVSGHEHVFLFNARFPMHWLHTLGVEHA